MYFDRSTSTSLRRPLYFSLLSNLGILLVEYMSKYSLGRSKVSGSKYRKGQRYENGGSTEKVPDLTSIIHFRHKIYLAIFFVKRQIIFHKN